MDSLEMAAVRNKLGSESDRFIKRLTTGNNGRESNLLEMSTCRGQQEW